MHRYIYVGIKSGHLAKYIHTFVFLLHAVLKRKINIVNEICILIGILTKKQGVSSLSTAMSLASFGMHRFGNVDLSTFLYIIWIHKIKLMTSWPIIVVGWGL